MFVCVYEKHLPRISPWTKILLTGVGIFIVLKVLLAVIGVGYYTIIAIDWYIGFFLAPGVVGAMIIASTRND